LKLPLVRTFAQTLRTVARFKRLIEADDPAARRDAPYETKRWNDARYDEYIPAKLKHPEKLLP